MYVKFDSPEHTVVFPLIAGLVSVIEVPAEIVKVLAVPVVHKFEGTTLTTGLPVALAN